MSVSEKFTLAFCLTGGSYLAAHLAVALLR